MAKKQKKEKIHYIDDGRTVADMSALPGRRLGGGSTSTAKEKWQTYWHAVKMMFTPMLIVLCAIAILYMLLWLIFFLMY